MFVIGPNRVDKFRRVPNPSIWMYYLPDLGTNREVGRLYEAQTFRIPCISPNTLLC